MPDNNLPALLPPDLKPVPAEYEPAWEKIQQEESSEKMRHALYLVTQGISPHSAGLTVGYAEGSLYPVYQKAKHYGIYRPQKEQTAQQVLEAAHLYSERIIRDLLERGDEISPSQAGILYGISVDKAVKLIQLDRESKQSATSLAMQDLLEQLLERGYSANLELKPPSPEQQAIDVTAAAADDVEEP